MHRLGPVEQVPDILAPYREVDRQRTDRPWVMANMVAGLDGTAAFDGRVGPLSHGDDVELFRLMRSLADVVLVGAETVRREGYGPVRLPPELRERRRAEGRPDVPPLGIVTRGAELDLRAQVFTEADPASPSFLVTGSAGAQRHSSLSGAPHIVAGTDSVDLASALTQLGERGHRVVLCEGGPNLLGQFVAQGLLDELLLTLSPVMGGDLLPVSVTPPGAPLRAFRLAHVLVSESTLFLRYLAAGHE